MSEVDRTRLPFSKDSWEREGNGSPGKDAPARAKTLNMKKFRPKGPPRSANDRRNMYKSKWYVTMDMYEQVRAIVFESNDNFQKYNIRAFRC